LHNWENVRTLAVKIKPVKWFLRFNNTLKSKVMETKKNPKADLEKRRGLYLEIGMVVILVASFLAFNVKSYDKDDFVIPGFNMTEVVEVLPVPTTPPPPPPPPAPEIPEVSTTELSIVDNGKDIETEVEFNAQDDENNVNIQIVPRVDVEVDDDVEEDVIVLVPEMDPEFPGGMEALYNYLAQNIKYPTLARETGITGKVYVSFVVERDGSIANIKVERDIGGGCGQEAIRALKSMPKWIPGKQKGRPVRVQFHLPVSFMMK